MCSPSSLFFVWLASLAYIESATAFVVQQHPTFHRTLTPAPLHGGFGGGGGMGGGGKKSGGKKKGKKAGDLPVKLKAKTQWDRYCRELKAETAFRVAVRVVKGDEKGEWLEIGRVRSEGDKMTQVAVAMQRGLIAEHAKRALPFQVKPTDMVEWGYLEANAEENSFTKVDKNVLDGVPKGTEKIIGFEGKADPGTGFYCHYDEGRLVDKVDDGFKAAPVVNSI